MSVKQAAGCVITGIGVAMCVLSNAQAAPALVINDGTPLAIQSPPGFAYTATGAGTSMLNVTTTGYLFCANVFSDTPPVASTVTLAPGHSRWTLPTAIDVRSVDYTAGVLAINKNASAFNPETTLACQTRGPAGEIANPFSAYGNFIFRDGIEPLNVVQYGDLVNWIPPAGFTWSAPDWSLVPTDPCTFDQNPNIPLAIENSLCAAASGVRGSGGSAYGERAATMWTQTTAANFIYLARIDGRFGAQQGAPNSHFAPGPQAPAQASSVDIAIRDGYDSNYLSDVATYCFLRALPANGLSDAVCSDSAVFFASNTHGTMIEKISLDNGWVSAKSLYVAVLRAKSADLPPINTPVAAMSVVADPSVSRHESGDQFVGDDVVFGFPEGQAFPWMGGQ